MQDHLDDLRFAHVLADTADATNIDRFKALDLEVETKPDSALANEAEAAVEKLIRVQLQRSRPRDAVLGEGDGLQGNGPRCWVVDAIDGLENYARGVPVWATQISLLDASEGSYQPVVGVVSAPALGRRWWAVKGHGAFTGRSLSSATRMRVSRVSRLPDASLAYSTLTGWEELGRLNGFLNLSREVWRTRAYGDFWPYMMVAEGVVDICADPELSPGDMAANAVIVTEAGGDFTGLDGTPGPRSGSAAASNGLLHDELLVYLNERH
ncbi:inositol monophosphatase family protein [Nocardia jinanensis]|uniref:Histidinol-phosphatase n=1 Tax=Nocardia jinanensis TaxID=382504 RepID=A0A917R5H1_9NOCA|nr:inositol monophosphatase family protein [Nocardia jinanensis]GGK90534.1 histidinol-phosphatase [Nocardia jinanensis]